jgi:pimeloyl-ACP methyl ester carboxylesterase
VHVLLLHGVPGGAADLQQVAERLAGRHVEVLLPDRPGWARESGEGCGIAGNVDFALARLDAAGAARAVVAGHSWGSLVALALAERAPERVQGVGLISPFGPGAVRPPDRAFAVPVLGPALASLQLGVAGAAQLLPGLRPAIAWRYGFELDALPTRGRQWLSSQARRAFLREERALLDELQPVLAGCRSVTVPAVVVVGARDHVTGARTARALAELVPGARLTVVPGAGHFLPLTHPEAVAGALRPLVP